MKMQTFRKPHQWLNFWLEKYTEVLSELKFSGDRRRQYWGVLKQFLEELPGNPRNIPQASIEDFIASAPEDRLNPITVFYQKIAPSKPHIELLRRLSQQHAHTPATGTEGNFEERFRLVLEQRNFSSRTIKNYRSSVNTFLKWLGPKTATTEKVEEYCSYLSEGKKLAQRTVALHGAALKLFLKCVIGTGVSGNTR